MPLRVFRLVMALACAAAPAAVQAQWLQIDAPKPFTDANGVLRTPTCSGGPELIETPEGKVPVPADTAYSFFFRPGDPDQLAVFWDGGGACWDANTCIGSALAGRSLYAQSVDETAATLDAADGLADFDHPDNPLAGYNQVFIPYCTADLHAGAADTTYFFQPPGGPVLPWTIHHRGADNVAAVLRWLTDYYENEIGRAPARVFLLGASAGGYGVLYHYPGVDQRLPPSADIRVMVDAANGVMNQDFYDRALTPNGAWAVWGNLAPELANAFASGPEQLMIETFKSLGARYPRSRFGQYTTAFDATQIEFFNIARHVASPNLWLDPDEIAAAGAEWTIRARRDMLLTALQTPNYRFYVARGTQHTVVANDKFYLEDSARGVPLVDWVDDMIRGESSFFSHWRNVSCTPHCLR